MDCVLDIAVEKTEKQMKKIGVYAIVALLILGFVPKTFGQHKRSEALNIYLDGDFDKQFLKENFTIVNYVRDRLEADVHIQMTAMATGGGGREFSLFFFGQKKYRNMQDTLVFHLDANFSKDEKRRETMKYLKLGLVPYLLRTPFVENLKLQIENQDKKDVSKEEDPWNHWVYSVHAGGFATGEHTYSQLNTWGGLSASRVTEKFKFESSLNGSFNRRIFNSYDGNELIRSDTASNVGKSFYALATKSLGKHWGIGTYLSLSQSYYSNLLFHIAFTPAIEYNVFDYAQASKKQLRLLYTIGPKYNQYYDTTGFDKTEELVGQQSISAIFKYITRWGDVNTSAFFSNYFHDFSLTNIGIDIGTNIRIVKGLSLRFNGSISFPHDQIEIRKIPGDPSDIYTRRVQMQTNYSYFLNVGFSYTFGSIYNNVVNPRFDRNYH